MQMYNSKSDRGCLTFMNYFHDLASSKTESSVIIVSSIPGPVGSVKWEESFFHMV